MGEFQEHMEKSKAKGLLAKRLYVVISTAGDDTGLMQQHFADHLAYQKSLEVKGVLFAAGPFGDENEEDMGGESLVIYRAANLAEAKGYAEGDPMHKAGARTYRLRPWLVNEGGFTVKVTFSDGGREFT
ncbi:MAG: YciI family protein [Alphaproteobacteria bacterium]|nr:YciI family protein [Alphaproteobacteria bacterium]